jgi:multisubunit Na+/H+ antiporter MnhC subunit
MNVVYSLTVGLLVAIGVYQLMGRDLFRIAFGLYIILNAVNLLVLAVATQHRRNAPLTALGEPFTDPLVQAMVLTAIVIGFGVSTFLLLITARIVRASKSLKSGDIKEWRN